jgi:serine/threonine-protein kinase
MKPNDTSKPKLPLPPSHTSSPQIPRPVSQTIAAPRATIKPKVVNSPHDLQQGAIVANRYVVDRVIGEGNVSLVVAAKNLDLGELVALKILKPEMLTQPGALARFGREAKASVQIRSEYAAAVYDVGQLMDGTPFLVMEFLDGLDMERHVASRGALEVPECIECILQVCEALAIAHSKGITHRDIKPENLFRIERANGMFVTKVIDFGISKAALVGSVFGANLAATESAGVSGTPYYMSPEQVSASANVDMRTDIWSLGVVMYELLTGSVPFPAESFAELCSLVLTQPAPDVRVMRHDVPFEVAETIRRCLEKDPKARYQNVAELAVALYPFSPKRARLNAERAVAVLKAAGMADVNLSIESIMPGPDSNPSAPSMPSIPRARSSISGVSGIGRTSNTPFPIDMAVTTPGSTPGSKPSGAPSAAPSAPSRPGAWAQGDSHTPPPQPQSAISRVAPILIGASLALAAAMSIAYFVVIKRKPLDDTNAISPSAALDNRTPPGRAPQRAGASTEVAATTPVATTPPTATAAAPPTSTAVAQSTAGAGATTQVPAAPPTPVAQPGAQAGAQGGAPKAWTWTPPPQQPRPAAPPAATATAKPKNNAEPDLGY